MKHLQRPSVLLEYSGIYSTQLVLNWNGHGGGQVGLLSAGWLVAFMEKQLLEFLALLHPTGVSPMISVRAFDTFIVVYLFFR